MPEIAGSYIGITVATRDGDFGIWANSYYTGFEQTDAAMYAFREDRNLVMTGGGKISWNGTSVAFSANIDFINHITAFKHTLTTAASPVALDATGKFAYFTIGRKPSVDGTTTSASSAAQGALPNAIGNNSNYVLAYRTADATLILPFLKKELLNGDYFGLNGSLTFFEYRATAFKPTVQTGSTSNKIKIAGSATAPACVIIDGKMYASTSDVEADITVTGIGGLDTGAIAANTLYNVFAVPGSGRAVALVMSASATPSGFSSFTKIDEFNTNPSATVSITTINGDTADVINFQEQAAPSNPSSGFQKIYVNSTTKKLTMRKSDGSEVSLGGGSGNVNYITNGDAEGGTAGWETYADAAATSPVDGDGGSPTVTLAASATTPLVGTNSFIFTKDAANRQGEGASYDFTIDEAYKGKVLQGIFSYLVNSGTFADDDVSIWIYDITNGVLIQPTPYKVKNTGVAEFLGFEFQTAIDSTSYRLIIHVGSTSASAYSLKFEVSVGPNAKLYGSPITDWEAFTPVGNWVANTAITGFRRRVGGDEEVVVQVATSGVPTSGILQITTSRTIDTARLPTGYPYHPLGIISVGDGSTLRSGIVSYLSATTVTADVSQLATHAGTVYPNLASVAHNVPFNFGASDYVVLKFSYPVAGWGASTIMSSDASTRVVAAKYQSTAATSISSATQIPWATKIYDTHNAMNISTGVFTCPVLGVYRIAGGFRLASASYTAGDNVNCQVRKNGVSVAMLGFTRVEVTAARSFQVYGATSVYCNAGDTLDLVGTSSATAAMNGTAIDNHISIELVQGPAQLAASESVNLSYYQDNNQNITSSIAVVVWNTKVYDSHNAMASGVFTAPVTGKYHFSANLRTQATSMTISDQVALYLYKNGAQHGKLFQKEIEATQSIIVGITGSMTVHLLAGETADVRASSATSALLSNAATGECHISIDKVGN